MKLRYILLLLLSYFLVLFFMISITPCKAFDWKDFNGDNATEKISDSLKIESEKWILEGNGLLFFPNSNLRKIAMKYNFPDVAEGCLIEVCFEVVRKENGYVYINKPFEHHFKGEKEKKLKNTIRQFIYNHLHNEFGLEVSKKEKEEVKKEIIHKQPKLVDDSIYGNNDDIY